MVVNNRSTDAMVAMHCRSLLDNVATTNTVLVKPGSGFWDIKQGVNDCKLHQAEQLENDLTLLLPATADCLLMLMTADANDC